MARPTVSSHEFNSLLSLNTFDILPVSRNANSHSYHRLMLHHRPGVHLTAYLLLVSGHPAAESAIVSIFTGTNHQPPVLQVLTKELCARLYPCKITAKTNYCDYSVKCYLTAYGSSELKIFNATAFLV